MAIADNADLSASEVPNEEQQVNEWFDNWLDSFVLEYARQFGLITQDNLESLTIIRDNYKLVKREDD